MGSNVHPGHRTVICFAFLSNLPYLINLDVSVFNSMRTDGRRSACVNHKARMIKADRNDK